MKNKKKKKEKGQKDGRILIFDNNARVNVAARERVCLRRSRVLDEIIKEDSCTKCETSHSKSTNLYLPTRAARMQILVGTNTAAMEVEMEQLGSEALKNEEKEEADMDLEATVDVVWWNRTQGENMNRGLLMFQS